MKTAILNYNYIFFTSILYFTLPFFSYAQWTTVNVGLTNNLYSVDYHSTNDIWIGSSSRLVNTTNNGGSWTVINPIVDQFNASIPGSMEDVEVINSTTALATGLFYLGNIETILKTTNSGTFWSNPHADNTVPILRYLKSIARNGAVSIAVGNTGRIARSTNDGTTWSIVASGTTSMINDIKFITPTNVIAVGENVVLMSFDAGLTWDDTIIPGSFLNVSCPSNCIYIGDQYSDTLYKSLDNAQTFIPIQLPFDFNGVVYAINADTVLASSTTGLYVSFDGGFGWEKYNLTGYKEVLMMDFINHFEGIAVGRGGYVIRTNNISSAPSLPIVSFSIPGGLSYCVGDTLSLVNHTASIPGYTYTWKLNNSVISSLYNVNHALSTSGSYTISLTVTNQHGSTTVSEQITVTGHDLLPFSIQASPGNVCSGMVAVITVPNSQTGTSYKLRNGFSIEGIAQNGNGSLLTFISTTIVSAPTDFNIIATRTNSCFTDSVVRTATLNAISGGLKTACVPAGDNPKGITGVTFNTINNSSPPNSGYYYDYSCMLNTNVLVGNTYPITITVNGNGHCAVWIDYDSSGTFLPASEFLFTGSVSGSITRHITIPPLHRLYNIPLRMRVGFSQTAFSANQSCGPSTVDGEFEDYSITVFNSPIPPVTAFTLTPVTTCTTNVTFSNNTFNATSYLWDFGDGDTSSSIQPVHDYNTSGNYLITLIAYNSFGSDTMTQFLPVQIPVVPVPASCNPATTNVCDFIEISAVQISGAGIPTLSLVSPFGNYQSDVTCTKKVNMTADSSYQMAIQLSYLGTSNCGGLCCAWVDWNNDGIFDNNLGERLINGLNGGCPNVFIHVDAPASAVMNVPLRARIVSSEDPFQNSCDAVCGQFVDFTIVVRNSAVITVNFTANSTTACIQEPVAFTSTTTNAVSYLWDFGDGTTSTLPNPVHLYSTPGIYSVKQVACNGAGYCDSLTKVAYINVFQSKFVRNVVICSGQTYSVASNTYSNSGTYIDSLIASTGCDSIITTVLTVEDPVVTITPSGSIDLCNGDSVTLSTSQGFISWQWYRFNLPIQSGTNADYITSVKGKYWCAVYSAALCTDSSNIIPVTSRCLPIGQPIIHKRVGTNERNLTEDISIYPNPGNGAFTIILPSRGLLEIFYSITGSIIFRRQMEAGGNEIDLTDFAEGLYFVNINSADRKFSNFLVLMRN